jgi:anti-sigma factor ChrR (cupin superfamily)
VIDSRLVLSGLFGANQDFSGYAWRPFRPGIEIARLYGTGDSGPSAALLRYAAGARLTAHAHADYEHIFVLAGAQHDEHGVYPAGTCCIHAPGSGHTVSSEAGCVVLAIWNAPVVFSGTE